MAKIWELRVALFRHDDPREAVGATEPAAAPPTTEKASDPWDQSQIPKASDIIEWVRRGFINNGSE
jgi:hypothetical protein